MIAVNTIFVWQPCRPWPVSVPLSELGEVCFPMALLSSCASASATQAWDKLCWCPAVATHWNCARGQAAATPLAVPCPLGKEELLVPPILSKGTEMHAQKTNCMSSSAGSRARTWQTQCTSASSAGSCLSSLSVTRGPLFSGGTLNHPRTFALQVSSITSKCFGFVKPQLTSVPGSTM